jgi:hypothetical protein
MLASATMIAVGIGMVAGIMHNVDQVNIAVAICGSYVGLGLIGAGFGNPFGRPGWGAVIFLVFAQTIGDLIATL